MATQVEELSREEIRQEMTELARTELNTTLDDALIRLARGELDERIVSSRLRLLQYLLGDEPSIGQAAE